MDVTGAVFVARQEDRMDECVEGCQTRPCPRVHRTLLDGDLIRPLPDSAGFGDMLCAMCDTIIATKDTQLLDTIIIVANHAKQVHDGYMAACESEHTGMKVNPLCPNGDEYRKSHYTCVWCLQTVEDEFADDHRLFCYEDVEPRRRTLGAQRSSNDMLPNDGTGWNAVSNENE